VSEVGKIDNNGRTARWTRSPTRFLGQTTMPRAT